MIDARALLRRHGLRPKKRLGQNFLVDPDSLEAVIEAAELDASDVALEIGAGVGTLTRELAANAARVVAIEVDASLIPPLTEALEGLKNVEVRVGDALEVDLSQVIGSRRYMVVANIPYNITSALIRRLLEAPNPPRRLVLTVQQEVAERVIAGPGRMSLLSLGVQVYGVPQSVARIPAEAFYPVPEVDSAVIRIDPHASPRVARPLIEPVFALARAGFGQRRKMLKNSLSRAFDLPAGKVVERLIEAGVEPTARAQELSVEDWLRLAETGLVA